MVPPPGVSSGAWTFSVSELAAPGVEVGRLTASDSDLGVNAQLDFLLLDTDGAGDTFNITARDREAVIVLNKVSGRRPGQGGPRDSIRSLTSIPPVIRQDLRR